MTRFLMSLEESVDLVLHAFEHARQGDIFVQKSPASTVADLGEAVSRIFGREHVCKVIGTRHGEGWYETLVSREEMACVEDGGRYYRILPDTRDLNYEKYFVEGERRVSELRRLHLAQHHPTRRRCCGAGAAQARLHSAGTACVRS